MARLRLDISEESFHELVQRAVSERRPIPWQAEVILEAALKRRKKKPADVASVAGHGMPPELESDDDGTQR